MTNKADRTNKANTTQEHVYEDEKRGVSDEMRGFRPTKSDPLALFKAAKSELQRKSEGSRLDMGTFGMQTLTTALHTAPREPPDPSGGNAAVVRDKKVIRLSVLPDIRGGLPFYPSPLPYRFWQKECCRLVRLLSFCFSRMGVECKGVQWNGGLASGA